MDFKQKEKLERIAYRTLMHTLELAGVIGLGYVLVRLGGVETQQEVLAILFGLFSKLAREVTFDYVNFSE